MAVRDREAASDARPAGDHLPGLPGPRPGGHVRRASTWRSPGPRRLVAPSWLSGARNPIGVAALPAPSGCRGYGPVGTGCMPVLLTRGLLSTCRPASGRQAVTPRAAGRVNSRRAGGASRPGAHVAPAACSRPGPAARTTPYVCESTALEWPVRATWPRVGRSWRRPAAAPTILPTDLASRLP